MPNHPLLKPGTNHKAVLEAKKLTIAHLVKFGQADLAAAINPKSSVYGPAAVKGVRYVQRRYKLKVDGIVGPNTWKVLGYARKPRPAVPAFVVMTRLQWDARTPRGVETVNWGPTTTTRVHHTVTRRPSGSGKSLVADEQAALREIQKYHMDTRKYADIAYNFLIMPSGRVYEGRGKEVAGAHTLGHNSDCGVAFVGNYNEDRLTRAQILAYRNLRRKLGISKGAQEPHKATSNTSCPGTNVVEQLGL